MSKRMEHKTQQERPGDIRVRPGGFRGFSHLSGEVRTEASRLGVGEVGGRAQTLNSLGKHLLLEYYECDVNSINDVTRVEQNLNDAAEACGATIIKSEWEERQSDMVGSGMGDSANIKSPFNIGRKSLTLNVQHLTFK